MRASVCVYAVYSLLEYDETTDDKENLYRKRIAKLENVDTNFFSAVLSVKLHSFVSKKKDY